jgi:DNA-binding cell septation regulator SpoVG
MNITEIHIHPVTPSRGLVAFAHLILDDSLLLGSIAIYEKLGGGYRITYPQKSDHYVFHPITQPFSRLLEDAIINEMKNVMGKSHDGHHRPEYPAR